MRLVSSIALAAALAASAAAPAALAHGHASHATQQADIVDTAVSAGDFTTLVAAVQAAGLVDTLKGDGPFTVFAPADSAFTQLPAGEVERLLQPENLHELRDLLTFHVVPGRVTSDQLAGKILSVDTANGDSVLIDATDGVRVGNAQVVAADIATSNGVIHVVDRVIIPTG